MGDDHRCLALTGNGERCPREWNVPFDNGGVCGRHAAVLRNALSACVLPPSGKRHDDGGWNIYVLFAPEVGRVKVGTSGYPDARVATLTTASPCKLEVVWVQECQPDDEQLLHKRLRQFHVTGEWFSYTAACSTILETWRAETIARLTKESAE